MRLALILAAGLIAARAVQGQEPSDPTRTPAEASPAEASQAEARLQEDPTQRRALDAADRGLAWLATQQMPSGAWPGHVGHKMQSSYDLLPEAASREAQERSGEGHPGVTALCGMAFLAGGHLPGRGPYGAELTRTLDFVLAHVQEDGLIRAAGTRMYSHAFATLFLAEVHGMSRHRRTETRAALERAVGLIIDAQNGHGAWRYNPYDQAADLSVTVCQLQALRAARNIGLHVPAGTIDRATRYVLDSRTQSGRDAGLFYYKIHGSGAYRKNTQYAINAAAVTALNSAGVYDQNLTGPALRFVERQFPTMARVAPEHFMFWYGNYYACQAFYTAGGDIFGAWWPGAARAVMDLQCEDGRWHNRVGPGDEFSTAVACILLQVHRQYLPIFQR